MKQHAAISAGALRRAAVRGALAATTLSALVLAGLFAPGDTQGAGTFNVDGSVSKIEVYYDGACDAGTLQETIPSTGYGMVFDVTGPISGCVGSDDAPGLVLIDEELLAYSTVHTNTGSYIGAGLTPPFTLSVSDTDGFDSVGQLYVSLELMSYDSKTSTSFHIVGRGEGEQGPQNHLANSFVRAEGKLMVYGRPGFSGRGLPKYVEGGPEANTTPALHYPGADVRDPRVYLTCRGRLWQPAYYDSPPSSVLSRSRCYAILEPGYTPSEPYWPDDPYPGPVLSLKDEFWHDLSVGELNDGTGELTLVTEYGGSQCFEYIEDEAWFQITTGVFLDKVPFNEDRGDFVTYFYDNADCSEPATAWLEGTDNFSSTEMPSGTDTDGDGCPDGDELGGDEASGGLRDPFNPWDYMNPTGDGMNRVDDILAVVNQYFDDDNDANPGEPPYVAGYDVDTDRTSLVPGPGGWNLGPPNGQQRVDDILASVKSYFHDCSIP